MVAVPYETHKPLGHIYNIERNEEQLALLGRVNPLVVDDVFVNPVGAACPKSAENINAQRCGQPPALYYYRFCHCREVRGEWKGNKNRCICVY